MFSFKKANHMLWATNKIHLQRHHPMAPIQRNTYHRSSLEDLFFYEGQHNDVEAGMISNITEMADRICCQSYILLVVSFDTSSPQPSLPSSPSQTRNLASRPGSAILQLIPKPLSASSKSLFLHN